MAVLSRLDQDELDKVLRRAAAEDDFDAACGVVVEALGLDGQDAAGPELDFDGWPGATEEERAESLRAWVSFELKRDAERSVW